MVGISTVIVEFLAIKDSIKLNYKKNVDKAYKNHTSVNTCKLDNLDNFHDYYKTQKYTVPSCVLGDDKKSFNLFKRASLAQVKNKTYLNWNEFALRVFNKEDYPKIVEAIFYMYASDDKFYIAPQGKLKKYNIHLAQAQYYQKQLYKTKYIFKPIIGINMDELIKGKPAFHYFSEDQAVK